MIEGAGCSNDEDRLRLRRRPAAAAAPAAKTHGPKAKRAGKVAARPSVSVAYDSQTSGDEDAAAADAPAGSSGQLQGPRYPPNRSGL